MWSGSEQPWQNMDSWKSEIKRAGKSTEAQWSYGLSLFSLVKEVLRQIFISLSLVMGHRIWATGPCQSALHPSLPNLLQSPSPITSASYSSVCQLYLNTNGYKKQTNRNHTNLPSPSLGLHCWRFLCDKILDERVCFFYASLSFVMRLQHIPVYMIIYYY